MSNRIHLSNQRGISHIILPVIAVLVLGFVGLYLMTASNAETVSGGMPSVTRLQAKPEPWTDAATKRKGTDVSLTWNAVAGSGGKPYSYRVTRGNVMLGTTTGSSFTDSSATYRTAHDYHVITVDERGAISKPATVSITLPSNGDDNVPSAPTGMSSSVAAREASINWTPSSDNDSILLYTVNRKMVRCGDQCDDTVSFIIAGTNRTPPKPTYTDTSAKRGSSYSYWVTATDPNGNVSTLSDLVPVEIR